MKLNMKRALAILLSSLVIAAAFSGCGSASGTSEAVVMNGETITMDEMKMYAYTIQDKIEATYAWMIYYYGETYDNFWKGDSGSGNTTMWQENLKLSVQQAIQTKALIKYADENGITLTDDEKARVQETIGNYRKNHAKAAQYAGATDQMIEKYYMENALANKAALKLQEGVSTEFDQETFRRKRVAGVSISAKTTVPKETEAETTTEEATTEEGFTKTPLETTAAPTETYAPDEQKTAREEALKDIEARLAKGDKIEDVVADYKEDKKVTVTALSEFASSKSDEVEEGKEKSSYRNYAWALKTDEVTSFEIVSSSTPATVTGYVLRCVNDDDADYRKAAENDELEVRKTKQFQEKYAELAKKITGLHVYEEQIAAAVSYRGQTTEETTAAPTEAPTTTAAPETTTAASN